MWLSEKLDKNNIKKNKETWSMRWHHSLPCQNGEKNVFIYLNGQSLIYTLKIHHQTIIRW